MTNSWRIARRELRGGLRGFRLFVACLALGVGTIAAVGSIASSVIGGLEKDGAILLGGDATLSVTYKDISVTERAWLDRNADVSRILYFRSMARSVDSDKRTLTEIKMVDDAYPLYGKLEVFPRAKNADLFAKRDGAWGAVADVVLLRQLGINRGGFLRLGDATYQIRGTIENEPDRISGVSPIQIGPRLMASNASVQDSGLIEPGSQVWYFYRVRLKDGQSLKSWKTKLQKAFPDALWVLRDRTNASPLIKSFVDRTTLFMTLVGLIALLIGGVGVSNAVRDYLTNKFETIATLKCMGASARHIFEAYLLQVMIMALSGITLGLLMGGLAPVFASEILLNELPIMSRIDVYWQPLALAASFGFLTALAFSIWPIAQACDLPAAGLFRASIVRFRAVPRWPFALATVILLAALAILAIGTAHNRIVALWFVAGASLAMLLFGITGIFVARAAKNLGASSSTGLRLALANLHRPGAPTGSVVMSLGLGLTVLVTVALIEANLGNQITKSLPKKAPGYFFMDIQNDQVDKFENVVSQVNGFRELRRTPMLRGRVTRLNGKTAQPENVAEEGRWILRGDRGVTWARELPDGETVVAGKWWPANYSGMPLVSMAKRNAAALDLDIGDTITINILGRNITGEITNLRDVQWGSLRMNFLFIFSPGPLNDAPQTHLATVHADPLLEEGIERAVTDNFPNVTTIRVREVLDTVNVFLGRLGFAIRLTAGVAIAAGTLVLAGAVAAGHRRRIYDSIVLKVLGASRRRIIVILMIEYGLLGLVTALVASVAGSIAAWAIVTEVMRLEFTTDIIAIILAVAIAMPVTLVLGLFGTWQALGQKAAPLLRND
jgi:putative ABC transport system permease protein